MTRLEALRKLKGSLQALGIEDAEAEARHAMASLLDCEIAELFMRGDQTLEEDVWQRLEAVVKRRSTGEPLAYILEERWFMGLRFWVTPAVLIPRQDTELLAELAIERIRSRQLSEVLDLCTGSGCLAICLAHYTGAQVVASDISEEALAVAQKNARLHGANIRFVASDLFQKIPGRFSLITANPPYIREDEYAGLMREVRDFEPDLALLAGKDGLDFYRRLAREAGAHLLPGGELLLEIGCTQGQAVSSLLKEAGFSQIEVYPDLAGKERVVSAVMK